MTLYEMLKEIVEKGDPWNNEGSCSYCSVPYGQGHFSECTWRLAEEYVEKQEAS